MWRRICLIILLCHPIFLYAQKWEIGLFAGGANYFGDLAPDIAVTETNYSVGLFFKKNLNQYFSFYFGANQAFITGNDQNFNSQEIRNLSFQTNITEITYQLEFNFLPFSFGLGHKNFTPFTSIGLSVFTYDPKAIYNNNLIKLKPLDTEGRSLLDKKRYSLYQLAIPIGGGFKFNLSEKFIAGINVTFRYTFTDYLDDVSTVYYDVDMLEQELGQQSAALSDRSPELHNNAIGFMGKQRGRSDQNDWFILGGIFISHKIKNSACFEF
jgi:hypothetical protein